MKILPLLLAAAGVGGAMWHPGPNSYVVLITGDTDGYLSPCGCSKPMTGGVLRRLTALRSLAVPNRTVLLDNGGLVQQNGEQDVLKAETLAQLFDAANYDAVNFGPSEARLGRGVAQSIKQLSQGRFITGSLRPSPTNDFAPTKTAGPLLIGGASADSDWLATLMMEEELPLDRVVGSLTAQAKDLGLTAVLLLRGNHDEAVQVAKDHPDLGLIVFQGTEEPASVAETVGKTLLVQPGERGQFVLQLKFEDGRFSGYKPVKLTPDFQDDPDAKRVFQSYLDRVSDEHLLEKLSRVQTEPYSGSQKCGSCHADSLSVWKHSGHSHALSTLEKVHHDRDPDCVGCHVVGLDSKQGFYARVTTPQLADVGCESCHGPGEKHSQQPYVARLPKVTSETCVKCHTPLQSPGFDFDAYWQKIKHK